MTEKWLRSDRKEAKTHELILKRLKRVIKLY